MQIKTQEYTWDSDVKSQTPKIFVREISSLKTFSLKIAPPKIRGLSKMNPQLVIRISHCARPITYR